ncbi:MAG TPA: hypothetical protein EYO85_10930, partial [Rhodospirillales bacterium]|nr:hypothetical protein [Rhodospirillales bacterium]
MSLLAARLRRRHIDPRILVEHDAIIRHRRFNAHEAKGYIAGDRFRVAGQWIAITAAAGHFDDQAVIARHDLETLVTQHLAGFERDHAAGASTAAIAP